MASMKQYVAWADRRIGRLVVAEGLHCGLLGVTQGPLTLTFRVRLLNPSPTALRKLLALDRALSQALQVSGVRVTMQPGHVAIEIPSPQPRTPSAGQLARASRGLSVAVGFDAQRRPVSVDLSEHGALFWIGPSRRGKTQSMRSTLYSLARCNAQSMRFAILCHERKLDDWKAFEDARQSLGIVTAPAEQEALLAWAAGEMMTKMSDGMRLVIVVDDLLNLLSQADLAGPLAEIASMGAGLGIHLLAGTQEAGSKRGTGGAGVENNATARILYRNSSAAAAARATGQGAEGLQQLSGAKGDALLLLDGEPLRIATGLADDREILQLEQGEGWRRPWQHHHTPPATIPHATATVGPSVGHGGALVQSGATTGSAGGVDPLLAGAPSTSEERALVRKIYADQGSKNKASRLLWGYKSRQTFAWLNECIEGKYH